MMEDGDTLSLPRWVRRRYDRVRDRQVLLAPERVLFPCPTSVHILQYLEQGERRMRFGDLVDRLVEDFEAPRDVISKDVDTMLTNLIDQRFLDLHPA